MSHRRGRRARCRGQNQDYLLATLESRVLFSVWQGGTSTNWFLSNNWDDHSPPDSPNGNLVGQTAEFNGGAIAHIILTQNVAIESLMIAEGAHVSIDLNGHTLNVGVVVLTDGTGANPTSLAVEAFNGVGGSFFTTYTNVAVQANEHAALCVVSDGGMTASLAEVTLGGDTGAHGELYVQGDATANATITAVGAKFNATGGYGTGKLYVADNAEFDAGYTTIASGSTAGTFDESVLQTTGFVLGDSNGGGELDVEEGGTFINSAGTTAYLIAGTFYSDSTGYIEGDFQTTAASQDPTFWADGDYGHPTVIHGLIYLALSPVPVLLSIWSPLLPLQHSFQDFKFFTRQQNSDRNQAFLLLPRRVHLEVLCSLVC